MLLLATAALLAASASTMACSPAPIPFDRVLASAGPVLVVRVLGIRGPVDSPDALTLAVDDVWRGTAPPVFDIEPPVATACGDRVWARVGERLVLALDVAAFEGSPPLTAFWEVLDDDTLEPRTGETPAGVTTLAQLRGGFAPEADGTPDAPVAPLPEQAVVAVIVVLGIGALVLSGTIGVLARRRPSP